MYDQDNRKNELNHAILFRCTPDIAAEIFQRIMDDPNVYIVGKLFSSTKRLWISEVGV